MISKLKNHSFLSQIFMLLFGLINFKLAIDFLGVEGFGILNLYISIVLLFSTIFGLRIYEAGSYALNNARKDLKNLRSIYLYFFKLEILIKILLTIFFVLTLFVYNIIFEEKYEIYYIAFLILVNSSTDLSKQVLISLNNLKPYYYTRLIQPISLTALLITAFLNEDFSVKLYLIFYMLSILLESVFSFLFAYSLSLKYYSKELYKPDFNLLNFNKYSYFSSTFRALWEKTDYLWVNFLSNSEVLGLYSIAKKLVDYTSLLAFSYWNSLKPVYTKKYDYIEGIEIIKNYQKNICIFFCIVLIGFLIVIYPLTEFLKITNIKDFIIITLFLIISNLMWSLIVMSRYVATLFNRLSYSLSINIQLAFILNAITICLYLIFDTKNIYFIICAQIIIAIYAYIFWRIKIKGIYENL